MSTLLISLLTLVLLLISAFIVLIVLMQKTSQSGGMGAALGGGAAESAFGSETNNILTKGTIYGIIAFFLVALGLYLLYQAQAGNKIEEVDMSTFLTSEEQPVTGETATEVVESAEEGTSELPVDADQAEATEVESQVDSIVEAIDSTTDDLQLPAN